MESERSSAGNIIITSIAIIFVVMIVCIVVLAVSILVPDNNRGYQPDPDKIVSSMPKPQTIDTGEAKISFNFVINANYGEARYGAVLGIAGFKQTRLPSASITRVRITPIGVDVPIIHTFDGEDAIDKGWWLYPGSKDYGEKILLGHRRYWGIDHPYSAWRMDELQIGQIIEVIDTQNVVHKYQIVGQSITNGADTSIFRTTDEDILKIITCSTFSGQAGSSEYRHVTIAKRVDL